MWDQSSLFESKVEALISVDDAAKLLKVSQATIRNWVKAGHIREPQSGKLLKESLEIFSKAEVGTRRLTARANKRSKDTYSPEGLRKFVLDELASKNFSSDAISSKYEEMLAESFRNEEGIYYTPPAVIDKLFSISRTDISNATFCDPCCGSGNFIVSALKQGFRPENVYGYDTDPNAVEIAVRRIYELTGYRSNNIKTLDFLLDVTQSKSVEFDYVYTNPPWGKKIPKEERALYGSLLRTGRSLDTCALFFAACLKILKTNGELGLLLPESFFNIASFEDVRLCLLAHRVKRIIDFGRPFKTLMTRAVGLVVINSEHIDCSTHISCEFKGKKISRKKSSFQKNPKAIFNYWCSSDDATVISRAYDVEHIMLKGRCKWGLGIVTGDNSRFFSDTPRDGFIPVFRGSDLTDEGLMPPSVFIPSDLSIYQQVAPKELYEAKEKLIYKFISSKLHFYHDTKQRYLLNSVNMLIPHGEFPIKVEQLCDLLNSRFIRWMFTNLFRTHKVLRGDLEQLPIHAKFFSYRDKFCEEAYLEFLSIERLENGAYRVKG